MEAVNIYTYSRIQEDMATEFENILSQRSKKLAVKVQEFAAIKTLVDLLLDINIEIKNFENFFASFTIEQIGKEFDLIKPDKDNFVLNIELKTINEQISNFAQTYPTNLKASSNEALLFMRRYRFANCSCFSCCFKDAYPSSNVQ